MVFVENGFEKFRMILVKLQRLQRGPMRRKLFIGIWVAVVFISTVLVYRYKRSRDYKLLVSRTRRHLEHYCNQPGIVLGNEYKPPLEYSSFKLKQVHVIVRHGDRSSVINDLPSTITPHHFTCKLDSRNKHHAQKLSHLKEMQKIFKKKLSKIGRRSVIDDFVLHEGVPCKLGQLTAKGFLQHILLGEHMYKAYRGKLDLSFGTLEEEQVLVFTTPVERTQQSAAAFISGMFYPVFKKMQSLENFPTINMQVSSDKMGFFRDGENGEVLSCSGPLREARQKGKQTVSYRDGLSPVEVLLRKYSSLFQIPEDQLPTVTGLSDLVLTHYCHHHPALCGPNGCMDKEMQSESLAAANWAFTTNYTPIAEMVVHTLLSKVVRRMLLSTVGQEHSKFLLYATHDSTIVPVLIMLGIFRKEWVPYTSRVVFELWEAEGLLAIKLNELDKYFVRILYNGKDLTHRVAFCKDSLKFGKLCSLSAFKRSLEAGAESMEEHYFQLCKSSSVI